MATSVPSRYHIAFDKLIFGPYEFLLPLGSTGKWASMFATAEGINAE
jgi:hypothetical protein